MTLPIRKKVRRGLVVSVLAGILLYGVSIVAGGVDEFLGELGKVTLAGWLLVLALSLVNYGLRFLRWRWYLKYLNANVPATLDLLYYVAGFALTTTPGKAGEAIRSLYLKEHGVSYAASLAALMSERLVDLLSIVLLASLAIVYFEQYAWIVVLAAGAVLLCLPAIGSVRVRVMLQSGWGSGSIRSLCGHLGSLLDNASSLLRLKLLYPSLLIGLAAWAAEGIGLHYILQYLGADTTMPLAIGVYAVSILIGAVSFIPAGLGTTEASMGVLLVLLGVPTSSAVVATVICRVATLWFAVVLGVFAMLLIETHPSLKQAQRAV